MDCIIYWICIKKDNQIWVSAIPCMAIYHTRYTSILSAKLTFQKTLRTSNIVILHIYWQYLSHIGWVRIACSLLYFHLYKRYKIAVEYRRLTSPPKMCKIINANRSNFDCSEFTPCDFWIKINCFLVGRLSHLTSSELMHPQLQSKRAHSRKELRNPKDSSWWQLH